MRIEIRRWIGAFALVWSASVLWACSTPTGNQCEPRCGDTCGIDDGCKGICGCPGTKVCGEGGRCVDPIVCTETCASKGAVCGEVCGEVCGRCQSHESCESGKCACKPNCDGTHCGDDGCGGVCECPNGTAGNSRETCVPLSKCIETCESVGWTCGKICGVACGSCPESEMCLSGKCQAAVSCAACSLKLVLLEKIMTNGNMTGAVLAVEYTPAADEDRPRMADLRLQADGPVTLSEVVRGPALSSADKELYVDPTTSNPWRVRADGTFQVLALSLSNANTFGTGRLFTLRFVELNSLNPVTFSLVRRAQTFAPPEADGALQATGYELPVVVSP